MKWFIVATSLLANGQLYDGVGKGPFNTRAECERWFYQTSKNAGEMPWDTQEGRDRMAQMGITRFHIGCQQVGVQ